MSKVAVMKTSPETYMKDYSELMNKANYKKAIDKKHETLLKINLSWSLFYPACSTPPWQLDAVMGKLIKDGYNNLLPVENKTVVTDVQKGVGGNKWGPIFDKYNINFTALPEVEWTEYKPEHEMLAILDIFPEGLKIPKMFKGKNVIHLPTIKVHGHTHMTGAMKNAFGGLITEKRHHCHKAIHEVLVDLLQIQKEIHPGMFAVMDGTVAGDGSGPRTMEPKIKDYILASEDQVSIDAISAKMMGFDPMNIKFIRTAHDRGLGIGDPDQIEIVGEDISDVNFNFTTKKSPVVFFDQVFRKKIPFIEPLLFHTKLFKTCIFASAFYHDYLWYPTVGKSKIREFKKTKWGQLFEKY
ncbi:MAG: DUF362 domain-containing protein [Candidatus Aenigmatarchaeota archaeon]